MTPRMAAIFGTRADEVIAPNVVERQKDNRLPDVTEDPAKPPADGFVPAVPTASWPIIKGSEHFSIWVDDAEGPWPEFVPGYHYDIRQPSRLRGLLSQRNQQQNFSGFDTRHIGQ